MGWLPGGRLVLDLTAIALEMAEAVERASVGKE